MFKTNMALAKVANSNVVEWDIRAANVSIMEYYGLAPPSTIKRIKAQDKSQREIIVGKLQGKVKGFAHALEDGFNRIVAEFIEANQLDYDTDIVSIKRDAVFVKDRPLNDESLSKHEDGMLDFIRNVVYTWHDTIRLYQYMKQYCDAYKKKELDFNAYRRFDSESCFDVVMGEETMRMAEIDESDMDFLDISFNYMQVIIPTLQMVI